MEALERLDYPNDRHEVIVVDDGSVPPVEPFISPFAERLDLTIVRQEGTGPAAARNKGAERAQGELLVFIDDDVRPDRGWLRAFARRSATDPGRALGGHTENALPDNPYAATSQLIVDLAYAHHNSGHGGPTFFASNNLAVPTKGFRQLGGFDPSFRNSEDRDFCDRWLFHGFEMSYEPTAVARHANPLTLRTFVRQHFGYGRGAYAHRRARARRGTAAGDDISPGFHLVAVPRVAAEAIRRGRLRQAGLIALWQLANLAGFLREAWARGAS
jgi:glycosyltransferase involved in cell wall biosynthesis